MATNTSYTSTATTNLAAWRFGHCAMCRRLRHDVRPCEKPGCAPDGYFCHEGLCSDCQDFHCGRQRMGTQRCLLAEVSASGFRRGLLSAVWAIGLLVILAAAVRG